MALTIEEKNLLNKIKTDMKVVHEEIKRFHNKLDAMNSYYADVMTKLLIKDSEAKVEKTTNDKNVQKKTLPRKMGKSKRKGILSTKGRVSSRYRNKEERH